MKIKYILDNSNIFTDFSGNISSEISEVSTLDKMKSTSLSWCKPGNEKILYNLNHGTVISKVILENNKINILKADNPKLALNGIIKKWFYKKTKKDYKIGIKSSIGNGVIIEPGCIIGDNVKLGKDNRLISNVHITGNTTIGDKNVFYPFSSIGAAPQDLKFKGEKSFLIIGNNNTNN